VRHRPGSGPRPPSAASAQASAGDAASTAAWFELRFFDLDEIPRSDAGIDELLEDFEAWGSPLSRRLSGLRAALQGRYPRLLEDPVDNPPAAPGSSGPAAAVALAGGRCLAMNLRPNTLTRNVLAGIEAVAADHGVTVYDPRAGTLTLPNGQRATTRRITYADESA